MSSAAKGLDLINSELQADVVELLRGFKLNTRVEQRWRCLRLSC